jgi:hypothetical protein
VAIPVAAQSSTSTKPTSTSPEPIDISAGYNFLTFAPGGGQSTPTGLYFGANSTGAVGFAGEVDGNFGTNNGVSLKAWSFLGGVRFTGSGTGAKPYAQVLAGLTDVSGGIFGVSASYSGFSIAPGGGVDVTGKTARVGVRVQGAFLLTHVLSAWEKGVTLGVGIVFGTGKK